MSRIVLTLVIPTLDRSGAEKQLMLLATGLDQRLFDIDVVALNRSGPYGQELDLAGIPVTVLNKRFRIDPVTHLRLARHIRRRDPHVVHGWLFAANTHVRLLKQLGRFGGQRGRWKCVVSERCVDSWKASWQLRIDRILRRHTEILIANSNSVAEFYQSSPVEFPAERVQVIHNGVTVPPEPRAGRDHPDAIAFRRRWGFPDNAIVLGTIGRIASQKRIETLLWAMHLLRQVHPQVRALIFGDGPQRDDLTDLAEKYEVADVVCFAGHHSEAAAAHKFWDVYWQASAFEGQSNSLLEAMAAGVPVLASDIPPNRELITPEQHGLLAPGDDAAEFALQARRLIDAPQWAQELGERARQRVAEEFSVARMIEEHATLYRRLTESSAGDMSSSLHTAVAAGNVPPSVSRAEVE